MLTTSSCAWPCSPRKTSPLKSTSHLTCFYRTCLWRCPTDTAKLQIQAHQLLHGACHPPHYQHPFYNRRTQLLYEINTCLHFFYFSHGTYLYYIFFLILNKIKLFNLLRHASDTPLYSLTCEGFPGVSSLIQHIKLEIRTSCAHE